MNSNEFKDKLTSVAPEVPEHFHNRVEMTLENIVTQEAQMKESTKQAIKTAGRFSSKTIAIALAITLLVGAVAFAATQWNLFASIPFLTGNGTPKNADSVMQSNLYQGTVNNVEITVREAGYDGKTLLLQYSYRILDVDTPYGLTASEMFGDQIPEGMTADTIVEGLKGNAEADLEAHHVGWWIDAIWLNGKEMAMPNNSGSVVSGSTVPGEIIHTEYWRLDNEGFSLNGPIQISLPIGEQQDLADYSRKNHPEKYDVDGSLKLPEGGIVTFTYDAKDILAQVNTLHPTGSEGESGFSGGIHQGKRRRSEKRGRRSHVALWWHGCVPGLGLQPGAGRWTRKTCVPRAFRPEWLWKRMGGVPVSISGEHPC